MPRYDGQIFDPPAPVIQATVRGPLDTVLDVPFLIDTGSDASVVPLAAVEAVGAAVLPARVPIEFYSGAQQSWDQAHLSIEFARFRFSGAFLVAEAGYGILGRNILNLLELTLDGPRLTWSLQR